MVYSRAIGDWSVENPSKVLQPAPTSCDVCWLEKLTSRTELLVYLRLMSAIAKVKFLLTKSVNLAMRLLSDSETVCLVCFAICTDRCWWPSPAWVGSIDKQKPRAIPKEKRRGQQQRTPHTGNGAVPLTLSDRICFVSSVIKNGVT
jgi:hypothetical protein